MAKIKFDTRKATNDLKRKVNKSLKSKKLTTDIGKFLVGRVKLEARRGKPLNEDRKFPKLSNLSVKIRKHLDKYNKTGQSFSPRRSNLTFTGQLQDALTFVKKKTGLFELFIKKTRRRALKGKSGLLRKGSKRGPKKSPPNNQQVDKKLRDGVGRKNKQFILFDKDGLTSEKLILDRIKQIYLRFLRRNLRKT